ncbi:hypothetical protein QTH87_08555 [Variovorax sp. J22P168]|nr:hypothetical protein [Variovorax sp. J22P168]
MFSSAIGQFDILTRPWTRPQAPKAAWQDSSVFFKFLLALVALSIVGYLVLSWYLLVR